MYKTISDSPLIDVIYNDKRVWHLKHQSFLVTK